MIIGLALLAVDLLPAKLFLSNDRGQLPSWSISLDIAQQRMPRAPLAIGTWETKRHDTHNVIK
jgi:hypothetical protein